ncbi:hypothetical protein J4573_08580 [Actinomadura barringtoniae]|uniref:Uncharacterized protein n=1 Tax=Actinomadura barringtoniae TaxID=1427535 RepID=A0A939PDA0_9ACTN|nr:hypothetical protein [Actinomadura barringtoniae]MBO2447139.1 hypothetical protein [Actinomadura barringtoniae]
MILTDALELVTKHLTQTTSANQLLAAIRAGLNVIDAAVQELEFLDPLDPPPDWPAVHDHCAKIRSLLARAPSYRQPPPSAHFRTEAELRERDVPSVIEALIETSNALVLALVECAAQARNPADEICCRSSALCGADLHGALVALRGDASRPSKGH